MRGTDAELSPSSELHVPFREGAPARMPPPSRDQIVVDCATLRIKAGVVAVLSYLNARTRFRYTGVYHADPPVLRNVFLFDRENPALNLSGDQAPLEETYCAITYETRRPFVARDGSSDPRLQAYAARASVISYAGVPIKLRSGGVWGTLCHFDVRPRLLAPDELEVLEVLAPLFGVWLNSEQPE